jgi:hypothetical protein
MGAKSYKTYRSEISMDSEISILRKIFQGVEDKRAFNASHKLDDIPMGYHIVSCDGVQHFSSKKICCPGCLTKTHKDGSCTYHHNMLCAALVHPDKREVFIMDVELIVQQDEKYQNAIIKTL